MPGPRAQLLVLAREDREKLERIERAATSEQRKAVRARIALRAAEGQANSEIARDLGIVENTVRKWRGRVAQLGVTKGLVDHARSGRPAHIAAEARCQLISLACRPVPRCFRRNEWTLLSLRQAMLEAEYLTAISKSTIWRVLNQVNLKPHRYRMWVHSPDPEFARKVREVVDLYLRGPRLGEVVLCVDEKTGMQALRRRFDGRLPAPGQLGRWEFEYKRHGTRTLLAAFNPHDGSVLGRCTRTRKGADLIAFMDEVVATRYPTEQVHVVWDNLNIHSGPRWQEFNQRHGHRFHFHYTPLHASWVNQVEMWFGVLARRVLRRASFHDAADLCQRVDDFIEYWNRVEKKPFRWTFTGYPVDNPGATPGAPKR